MEAELERQGEKGKLRIEGGRKDQVRAWARLQYFDPVPVLIDLRKIGQSDFVRDAPYKMSSLRTKELRPYGERRLGAIFCWLMGEREGSPVHFAHTQDSDHDFVARFRRDDALHFVPIQMKELVPAFIDQSGSTLQSLVDAIKERYLTSSDLAVAINVNREQLVEPTKLDVSGVHVGSLWLFGARDPQQREWMLVGNLLEPNWQGYSFTHPGLD